MIWKLHFGGIDYRYKLVNESSRDDRLRLGAGHADVHPAVRAAQRDHEIHVLRSKRHG